MIFKPELIPLIVEGRKIQTRRLVKPNELSFIWDGADCKSAPPSYADEVVTRSMRRLVRTGDPDRTKWSIGNTYAVVPKRGYSTVMTLGSKAWVSGNHMDMQIHAELGWQPLRIRILSIRREPLQAITEADAKAEGVADVAEYAALWDSINKRRGTRFADNPAVWVLTFEVVK